MALRGILSVAKSSRMLPLVRQASSDPPVIKPLAMLTYEVGFLKSAKLNSALSQFALLLPGLVP
jgi:hypothetical protein